MNRRFADRLRKSDYCVADAPFHAARDLVEKHHYSGGGSNTFVYCHGLYQNATGRLVGVAWWLPPTRVACESVQDDWKRVISLTRLVVEPEVPKNACSFLLAGSTRWIDADGYFTGLVTYADESQGHTGSIYRAANWQYVGRTGPYPRWIDPTTGRQVAVKATRTRTVEQMRELGYERQGSFHKHKFVKFLRGKTSTWDRRAKL